MPGTRGLGLLARLDAKLDRSGGPDACWPFRGAQSRGARRETTYGSIQEAGRGSRVWRVNRLVLLLRDVPEALRQPEARLVELLHLNDRLHRDEDASHDCDHGPCGNPAHLQWKPHAQNVKEQAARRAGSLPSLTAGVTAEMEALAAWACADLRAEREAQRPQVRRGPWWPPAEEEAA